MAADESPGLPQSEDLHAIGPALTILRQLQCDLDGYRASAPPAVLSLLALDRTNRMFLEQSLGEGEVSGCITGSEKEIRMQETRLAGVWWVRSLGAGQGLEEEWLEVADLPGAVRCRAFEGARDQVDLPIPLPVGILHAAGVLAEINALVGSPGKVHPPSILNLTLLPQTSDDLAFLDNALGIGPVSLLSRGYGTCRVTATRLRNCWRVRHYNSEERLILDSLELTEVPLAVLAAQEDLEDSAGRLAEILEAFD